MQAKTQHKLIQLAKFIQLAQMDCTKAAVRGIL